MASLICGSLAFDVIMQYPGKFSDLLLQDQLHKISVSFLVPTLRKDFGGCAGNIAYNLKLLGGDPQIMATIGHDGGDYLARLNRQGISDKTVRVIESTYTAQCFVTTDTSNNQINSFHPGAMNYSHENKIVDAKKVKLAIIAPDGREGMLQHAEDCAVQNIPLIFDPGQGMPMFSGEELKRFIELATYIVVNDYEAEMLAERTKLSLPKIAEKVSAFIITKGELGSEIFTSGNRIDIPCVKAENVVDPTGCGDAFRAGIMYGLDDGMDWVTIGRLSSLLGSIKICQQGPQNHGPSRSEIDALFNHEFGYKLR
jgi:adenosine kinase